LIDKRVEFPAYGEGGEPLLRLLMPGRMVKTAGEITPGMARFIDGLPSRKGETYVLSIALGSDEFYGPNINGDGFPEGGAPDHGLMTSHPRYGMKTFTTSPARCFDFHKNKDPGGSYGKVIHVVFNPEMHRVEIIQKIIDRRARDLGAGDYLDSLHEGRAVPVSMGCRVPWDECSICGKRAKTRAQYCPDLRDNMLGILPDGRQVKALNWLPRFFDISRVRKPADSIAFGLKKVASSGLYLSSDLADAYPVQAPDWEKAAVENKDATINKRVPGMDIDTEAYKTLIKSEKDLPEGVLRKMSTFPMSSIMASTAGSGMIMSPREFQYISLCKSPQHGSDTASDLHRLGSVFRPSNESSQMDFGSSDIIPTIIRAILPFLSGRSMADPVVRIRVTKIIKSPVQSEEKIASFVDLPGLGEAYNGYIEQAIKMAGEFLPAVAYVPEVTEASYGDNFVLSKMAGLKTSSIPLCLSTGSVIYMMTKLAQNAHSRKEAARILKRALSNVSL